MRVSRLDLDGKGKGSPEGLVAAILQVEADLPHRVPIEELARQLDISDIQDIDTNAFDGSLITDTSRSSGIILVRAHLQPQRRRFTIAHELGHFLIPTHMPNAQGRFICSREDFQMLSAKENDRRARMEVEANRFASLILIPPHLLRAQFKKQSSASLEHMIELARHFEVSKEAMARAYANYHPETIAIVICKDGKILRCYRNGTQFPFIEPSLGDKVPSRSSFHRHDHKSRSIGSFQDCPAEIWIGTKYERPLVEQVLSQTDGFAMILLQLEPSDDEAEEEERDIERSWKPRFHR